MFPMLLLGLTAFASEPATVPDGGYEIISAKRDVSDLQAQVAPVLAKELGGAVSLA